MKLFESYPDSAPETSETTSPVKEKSTATRNILLWFSFLVAFLVLLGITGSPVELRCRRIEESGPVNCVTQTHLLGIMPLPERRIDAVRGARVSESEDYEGDAGYRVELISTSGMIPLRKVYISDLSGKAAKEDIADQINAFVNRATPGTFTVTEPGMLRPETFFCFMIWLVGSFIWEQIKSSEVQNRSGF